VESKLLKAIEALESAGFQVDRACEETARDVGVVLSGETTYQHRMMITEKTGAILIRCTPEKE